MSSNEDDGTHHSTLDDHAFSKHDNLVDWHTATLANFLKVVVAEKQANMTPYDTDRSLASAEQEIVNRKRAPIEEITDKIAFPAVCNLEQVQHASESVDLGAKVMSQLRHFVSCIAGT